MRKNKLLLTLLLLAGSVCNYADVTIGDLNYSLSGSEATVTGLANTEVTDLVIPEEVEDNGTTYSVTSIGKDAFVGCTELTSISIPNSVTSIGRYAFYGCTSLTGVTIPNSVTRILDYTFSGCSGLTSVTIGNSVTSIGNSAFSSCEGLTSVTIGNSVTSIGSYAFSSCEGLTSVTIGNSVTSIGGSAFYGCSGLTSVTIPNSVTSIGGSAFSGCSGLTSVTIPNSVTSIGSSAFEDCTGLTSVTIPNSITYIGLSAFYRCNNLTKVNITDLAAWCSIYFDNNPLSYAHHLYLNNEEITSLIIPNSVTKINVSAFSGCSGLTSVTIPNSVTSIGSSAFEDCTGLTSITIPNSVTSIGNNVFQNCTGLTSVTLPESITNMGDYFFSYCTNLTSVTIPESVTAIGRNAFDNCTSLTSITIPNSVTSIGICAFQECSALTSVSPLPNSITKIEGNTFYGCIALSSINIPNTVTTIGDQAFAHCHELTSIDIPNSVTSIGRIAFYDCTGLTKVNITDLAAWCNISFSFGDSSNPLYYANHLYLNNEEITDLVIPESVTSIGNYAFSRCSGLTSVTIPNSVTSIGSNAFYGCTSLTSVTIPNSVTSIGSSAFYGCTGLTSITIPNSVTSIGNSAFCSCTGLRSIITQRETPFGIAYNVFDSSTNRNAVLVVPNGTSDAYKETYGWKFFTNIIEYSTMTELCTQLPKLIEEADSLWQEFSNVASASDELTAAANSMRTLVEKVRDKVDYFCVTEDDVTSLQNAVTLTKDEMITHRVIYIVDDEVYEIERYKEGEAITILDKPTKEHYNFLGWYNNTINIFTMGTEDITFTGTFRFSDAEGYSLEFLPFKLSMAGGADATAEIVFNVGSDVAPASKIEFDLVIPQAWYNNQMYDNVMREDLGTRFYNLYDPVNNGNGTWHFALEAKNANHYFGNVPSTKVGSFQIYQDGGGDDGNYAIEEGIYQVELTNVRIMIDGTVYNLPSYYGDVYVGSPNPVCQWGVIRFAGDYSAPETMQLLTDALPTDDATITAVDLTDVTAVPDNTTISVANENALIYVQDGVQLANDKNVVVGDVCDNLVIVDSQPFGAPMAFTANEVNYTRSTTSRFGTMCLPYAVSSDASVKYYTLDRVEGSTLYLTEETEIAAGVPAVYENLTSGSTVSANASNVAIQGTAVMPTDGDLKLIGTFEKLVITDPAELAKSYYISKDQFHQATNSLTINPFRAYFTYTGSSSSKVFNIATEDDITGVGSLDSEYAEVEGIYSISGAKLPALQKGVNIVKYGNGKTQKIVVK